MTDLDRSDRIRLHPAVDRCCAGPADCLQRTRCARRMAWLPQGTGLQNFAAMQLVQGKWCSAFIALADANPAGIVTERKVKPAVPGM